MRTGTVSYKLEDLKKGVIIPIGFEGENDFTRVIIDAKEVFKNYPNALVSMKVQPPEGAPYPATVIKEENNVIWQVKAADVANRGGGELQLTFTEGETVIKTYIARTDIKRSLKGNGPAPDPVQDWIDRTSEMLEEADHAIEEAESAAQHAPMIGLDGYWYRWDAEAEEYVNTGTKAQGEKGDPGDPGSPGDPTQLIDDTAGEGQTGKTWSADKLDEELTDVKSGLQGMTTATAGDVGKALSPKTVSNGEVTEWQFVEGGGSVDPSVIAEAVDDWLDEHPEATTTVQDGSISYSKLDADMKNVVLFDQQIYPLMNLIHYWNVETDYAVYTTLSDSNWNASDVIPVSEGERYYIKASQGNTHKTRIWIVTDDNLLIKSMASDYYGTSAHEEWITIPSGGTKLLVTNTTSGLASPTVKKRTNVDSTLTEKGRSADAEATGNAIKAVDGQFIDDILKSVLYSDLQTAGNTGYINTSGAIVDYANAYVSDFLEVLGESELTYSLTYVYGVAVALAFYTSSKTFISGITAESGTSGNWKHISGTTTVPQNAKYIRVSMSKTTQDNFTASAQRTEYHVEGSIVPSLKSMVKESNPWNGKKWCAFGTSITDTSSTNPETGEPYGRYVPYLAELSGMVVTNRGIAGGTLGSEGIHGGTSTILNAILNSQDLDSFDLITIEGFVNDYACAVAMGQFGDMVNTTFYGALHLAIKYCLENSHAEIVLLTETTGKQYTITGGTTVDYGLGVKNSLNLYQQDYNDAIIRMGQLYGVHVIDAGGKSMINKFRPDYIIDQIHHTAIGGQQYANTIWGELKDIKPTAIQENGN